MKNSITRFVLLSVTVISLLGCFKGDTCAGSFGNNLMVNIELPFPTAAAATVEAQPQPVEQAPAKKQPDFTFNFPNVFNIFRYLF